MYTGKNSGLNSHPFMALSGCGNVGKSLTLPEILHPENEGVELSKCWGSLQFGIMENCLRSLGLSWGHRARTHIQVSALLSH